MEVKGLKKSVVLLYIRIALGSPSISGNCPTFESAQVLTQREDFAHAGPHGKGSKPE